MPIGCRTFSVSIGRAAVENRHPIVDRLAATPANDPVCNPYRGDDPAGAARRHNLALYLARMAARQPRLLLLGEALGHRGGRVTGVPFTCQSVLLSLSSPFDLFGPAAGFRASAPSAPSREATATAVWNALLQLDELPLLWNAFPFHPHQPGRPDSNRPPSTRELDIGHDFLMALLDSFALDRVIAVGNKAALALERWGVDACKVRHPGHGGSVAFLGQLRALLQD